MSHRQPLRRLSTNSGLHMYVNSCLQQMTLASPLHVSCVWPKLTFSHRLTCAVWEGTPRLSMCLRGGPSSSSQAVQDFLWAVPRICPNRVWRQHVATLVILGGSDDVSGSRYATHVPNKATMKSLCPGPIIIFSTCGLQENVTPSR